MPFSIGCSELKSKEEKPSKKEEEAISHLPQSNEFYDFNQPKTIDLPIELDEISGIAYYPKDTSVFAIIDEDAILYKIPLKDPKSIQSWIFGNPGDYEDLALVDSTFFVLKSNGKIYKLNFEGSTVKSEEINFNTTSKKVNEFETIYIDSINKQIHIVCKNCEEDNKSQVSVYIYIDSAKTFDLANEIKTADIADSLQKDKVKLRPSGGGVHTLTKDIYLVSSIAKTVTVFDSSGNLKGAYALDKKIYKQPEGLTFTPEGHLIISNEFAEKGKANLLIIKNKQAK